MFDIKPCLENYQLLDVYLLSQYPSNIILDQQLQTS